MSLLKRDEDDQLFSTPYHCPKKDKFWDGIIIGIFVLLAIFIVGIVLQAAF